MVVHIHGGSFARGGADDPQFPHMSFARSGVVTVAISYRLGLFGFMAIPDFQKEDAMAPGNFGLLDQRMALEWVRDHAMLFGGDPMEVSVFGESAGAASILHQMTFRNGTEHPLFRRAFLISPPALSGPPYDLHQSWIGYSVAARSMGCEPNTSTTMKCLREVPADSVDCTRSRLMVFPYVTSTPAEYLCNGWPINDRVNFPDVGLALAEGRFNKDVELVIGTDHDEGSVFVPLMAPIIKPSEDFLQRQFEMVYGSENAKVLWEIYKPGNHPKRQTSADSFGAITGDTILNCITWTHIHSLAKHSIHPIHRYGNEWVYNHAFLPSFGSFHTSALAIFYNDIDAGKPYPDAFTPDEHVVAEFLFSKVIDFVHGKGIDDGWWPSFNLDSQESLLLAKDPASGNLTISITQNWKSGDCSVWQKLYPPLGLWAPPSYADIWAEEPFVASILNGALWWVFLHLKLAGILVLLSIVVSIFGCVKCCCPRCCGCRKKSHQAPNKLKKD